MRKFRIFALILFSLCFVSCLFAPKDVTYDNQTNEDLTLYKISTNELFKVPANAELVIGIRWYNDVEINITHRMSILETLDSYIKIYYKPAYYYTVTNTNLFDVYLKENNNLLGDKDDTTIVIPKAKIDYDNSTKDYTITASKDVVKVYTDNPSWSSYYIDSENNTHPASLAFRLN